MECGVSPGLLTWPGCYMGIPLCVICCFSLAAFNICSLCLVFVNLINICLGVFHLGFILFGTLPNLLFHCLFPFFLSEKLHSKVIKRKEPIASLFWF